MKTYIVRQDGKGDYTTIQEAIDAWDQECGKIVVHPGQYAEQLTIDKKVRLQGA